ncbi:VTC domain-containing protein [Candidatus Pelagibacter sp.]|nr:VTC domain-containing protein [Candidatus Pelagibacter sp.]
MSFRLEKKIFISKENLFDFKKFLINKSLKTLYEPRKIQSLYFDNENLSMYADSVEGVVPRKKIRIRNYPSSKTENFFLEKKFSSVEGRFKMSQKISLIDYQLFIKRGLFDPVYGDCKQTLVVNYDREYLSLNKNIRVTIDTNINYNILDKINYKLFDPNVIVELKTSINQDIDELFLEFPLQEIRFSKYCNGIELFNLNKSI